MEEALEWLDDNAEADEEEYKDKLKEVRSRNNTRAPAGSHALVSLSSHVVPTRQAGSDECRTLPFAYHCMTTSSCTSCITLPLAILRCITPPLSGDGAAGNAARVCGRAMQRECPACCAAKLQVEDVCNPVVSAAYAAAGGAPGGEDDEDLGDHDEL